MPHIFRATRPRKCAEKCVEDAFVTATTRGIKPQFFVEDSDRYRENPSQKRTRNHDIPLGRKIGWFQRASALEGNSWTNPTAFPH